MKNPTITGVELYEYAQQNCNALAGFPPSGDEGYTHESDRTFFHQWLKSDIGQVGVPAYRNGRHVTLYVPVRFPGNTGEK